jgi:tetraacyldisaccharide 4'-kinase
MSRGLEQYHRDVISGADRSGAAALLRGCLSLAEPFYSIVTGVRNQMFAAGTLKTHRALRPVISVGNITTGGTGKTPVVRWLADALRADGHSPAILMRGYKAAPGEDSDEQRLLRLLLPGMVVEANPDRVAGSKRVIETHPQVDVLLLDDGFQHRRLHRDFDLVLIDASNPFGFEHILPRGLLREPLEGLSRASAFLITHAEQVTEDQRGQIASRLHEFNPHAQVYRCMHLQSNLRGSDGVSKKLCELSGQRVLTFCGIGNPDAFERQIQQSGAVVMKTHRFGDHHHYAKQDMLSLADLAKQAGAQALLTTEKDWVKIAPLADSVPHLPPVYRAELSIGFCGEDESRLLDLITCTIR